MTEEIGCGWHYTLLGRNFSSGYLQTLVEFVAEADLKRSSEHIFRSLVSTDNCKPIEAARDTTHREMPRPGIGWGFFWDR
jgi:hypothetical protein